MPELCPVRATMRPSIPISFTHPKASSIILRRRGLTAYPALALMFSGTALSLNFAATCGTMSMPLHLFNEFGYVLTPDQPRPSACSPYRRVRHGA